MATWMDLKRINVMGRRKRRSVVVVVVVDKENSEGGKDEGKPQGDMEGEEV